jgi:hypothetical protein
LKPRIFAAAAVRGLCCVSCIIIIIIMLPIQAIAATPSAVSLHWEAAGPQPTAGGCRKLSHNNSVIMHVV